MKTKQLFCLICVFFAAILLLTSCAKDEAASAGDGKETVDANVSADSNDALEEPVEAVVKYLQTGEYLKAKEEYDANIIGNAILERDVLDNADELIKSALRQVVSDEISCDDAQVLMDTVIMSGIYSYDEISNYYEDLDVISWYKSTLLAADEYMNSNDYLNAALKYAEILWDFCLSSTEAEEAYGFSDADFAAIETHRRDAVQLYIDEVISQANQYLADKKYDTAIDLIENAEINLGGHVDDFSDMKESIYTARFEDEMKTYSETHETEKLIQCYETAVQTEGITPSLEMTTIYTEAASAYRTSVIDHAATLYAASGWSEAYDAVCEGLVVLVDDAELLQYRDLYFSCAPVDLWSLTVVDDGGYKYCDSSIDDTYGRGYTGYYQLYSYGGDSYSVSQYGTVLLDGEYNNFVTTYFAKCNGDGDSRIQLLIYADDVLIYDSGLIDRFTETKTIELDVTGVKLLKIQGYSTDEAFWSNLVPSIYLTNTWVEKILPID